VLARRAHPGPLQLSTPLPEEGAREAAPHAGLRERKLPFADRALTIMVSVIVIDIFLVSPLADVASGSRHWSHILLAAVLLAGAMAIWGNLWLTDMFVAVSIASIGARLGRLYWGNDLFAYASHFFAAASFTLLAYLIARRVFAPGRINVHRIQGAVAVYLLAGLILGQVLSLISLSHPGAFLLLGHPASHEDVVGSLSYYSFVTLTTLGFGDITPVHPLARSFSLLGAVFGTLYPAVLIGRLVSQEIKG
jgi:hypothetical protein